MQYKIKIPCVVHRIYVELNFFQVGSDFEIIKKWKLKFFKDVIIRCLENERCFIKSSQKRRSVEAVTKCYI